MFVPQVFYILIGMFDSLWKIDSRIDSEPERKESIL